MDRPSLPRLVTLAVLLVAGTPTLAATAWLVDPAGSRLDFTATQAGGEFEGQFRHFDAQITFDPADLTGSRFEVDVDTASADTQEPDRDAALAGPDFFAHDRWPQARYVATRFTVAAPGRYLAKGPLTIRDATRDVPVTFSFRPAPDGRSAILDGEATIQRLDFGVGEGEWRDTKWVGNEVRIRFHLVLHRRDK
jgi:polyisoprenoid-binding protein YceI